jgi:DNA-binding response OmpR family regulator
MILLVEDEVRARRGYGNLLRMQGFEVREAEDARSALAFLNQETIDLVIADLMLPDTNGFELIDVLHAKYPKTPLIVISGHFSETIGGGVLDGTAHFMQKPINPVALMAMVRRLLSDSNSPGQQS